MTEHFAGRDVGQTQLPGIAQRSARRKKQSLQVISVRFATQTAADYRPVGHGGEEPRSPNSRNFREDRPIRCQVGKLHSCQGRQRLAKGRDREDFEPVRVAPGVLRISVGDEEEVGVGVSRRERLLLDAPDLPDPSIEVERAGYDDAAIFVQILAELVDDVQREGQAGGGATDRPGVELDREREVDRRRLFDLNADDGPLGLVRIRLRGEADLSHATCATNAEGDCLAGVDSAHRLAEILGRLDGLPLDRDDHIADLELPVCGRIRVDRRHLDAVRLDVHLVPQVAEGDGGGDLLRLGHLVATLLQPLGLADSDRVDLLRRHERCALVQLREDALEKARLADEDVDHVDTALFLYLFLAGHLDERVDGARGIGKEDVLVRGHEPEHPQYDGEREEDEKEWTGSQRDPASTPTTSRTASAERSSSLRSSSERSSSTISSIPPAPSFTGTPM